MSEGALRGGPTWALAALACVAVLVASDASLLEATRGGFGNGFGGVLIESLPLRAGYLGLSALFDGCLVLLSWAVSVPLLRAIGVRPWRALALACLGVLGAAAWSDLLIYQIHTTVGALITPGVVMELAGGDVASFNEAATLASGVLIACGVVSLSGLALGLRISDRVAARSRQPHARFAPPRARALLVVGLAAGVCATAILSLRTPTTERLREAARLQPAAALLTAIVNRVSDLDLDGAGLLSQPPDPAPFDSAIHAYALDVPGNGIDENGLAGDLPIDARAPRPVAVPDGTGRERPHVLVVYLESFRYDLLGAQHAGRSVTPFLDRLAAEGASSEHAYVHSPYTTRSRAQLFSGSLLPQAGQTTWIDDFRTRGYRVGHFSAQDDSFGDSEALLGVARANVFYDARRDTARRTSRSTAAASLQISWKLLLERVESFLQEARASQPMFLYVNFVDTHFPYHHDELDDLLGSAPVERAGIRSWNREQVWTTYLNAAANVDRAIEELVGRFRRSIGGARHVILVTSDHGQAFYEDGELGHGRTLDDRQTRVPLILWGARGVWPEPLGAADLRGLLLRALDEPASDALRFAPDPQRRIFQYLPNIERPVHIASRSLDGALFYEFARGVATREDGSDVPADDAALARLIHDWEALRFQGAGQSD